MKRPKVLVYCGTNNGEGLIGLFHHFDKIYAFDANPQKIEICQKLFNKQKQVILINAALHEKENEEVSFFITEKWDPSSSLGKMNPEYPHASSETSPLYRANETCKEIKVKTINLGLFLEREGVEFVDYLLTDLQGYDFTVLSTLKSFIDNKKIGFITCEVEDNNSKPIYLDIPSNKKSLFDSLLSENYIETNSQTSDGWTFDANWKLK